MQERQIELLADPAILRSNQLYLLTQPSTPQQQFLHLFAQRHLLVARMYHKNLPSVLSLLPATMAQSSLALTYSAHRILNRLEVGPSDPLKSLVDQWVDFFPTLKDRSRFLFNDMILMHNQNRPMPSYPLYMQFLDLIATDLMKLLKPALPTAELYTEKTFRDEIQQIKRQDQSKLIASDLLMFLSACIPKVLLNILLKAEALPPSLRSEQQYECLYVDREAEYILRRSSKINTLLKTIIISMLLMPLTETQQKYLMLIGMRYYMVYHHRRESLASEIIINCYNKLDEKTQRSMADQLALFLRTILKLGRVKLVQFIAKQSAYLRKILTITEKNTFVGYTQEAASPYSSRELAETITLGRGTTQRRYFEVFEQHSLFYYRILVEQLDVTVRLFYLGDFSSKKEVKVELLEHAKLSGEIKRSINAVKRGLYMFEFDNSQSWVNPKTVIYENRVFSPMQIKAENVHPWLDTFFENRPMNFVAEGQQIHMLQLPKTEERRKMPVGVAYLTHEGEDWTLRLQRRHTEYTYVTDNPGRMEQKIKEVVQVKDEFKWTVMNRVVDEIGKVYDVLRGIEVQEESKVKEKVSSKKKAEKKKEQSPVEKNKKEQPVKQVEAQNSQQELQTQATSQSQQQIQPPKTEKQSTKEESVSNDQKEAEAEEKQEAAKVREIEREILERTVTEEDESYEVVEHEMEQSLIMNQDKGQAKEVEKRSREEITLDLEEQDFYGE